MSARFRILHWLGEATLLLGMFMAFPGCMLILAGSWFTDTAADHQRDLGQGQF